MGIIWKLFENYMEIGMKLYELSMKYMEIIWKLV